MDEECILLFQAVSQINVYHFFTAKDANNDNDKNNEKIMKNNTSNEY